MRSELDLLELLEKGDENAFEKIFIKYFEALCLYSKGLTHDYTAAQDIVEDIFLNLWLNSDVSPIKVSVKKYLYQSVHNNSIKYISRKKNTIELSEIGEENYPVLQITDYPAANLILKDLESKASLIIDSLPSQCKDIYILHRNEKLKYSDIALKLNITVSTVKTQMSRAYAKLREGLKEFLYILLF